jgi:Uma2 family endonuclease
MSAPILGEILAGRAPAVLPLTVEQYHRMIAERILREGEPTELIDGILVRKDRSDQGGTPMSHGPRHALTLKRLVRAFRPVEEQGYHLHAQLPLTLAQSQEPEPDLAVVQGGPENYQTHHPGPADVLVVIEVSDSTLEYDRTTKQRIYAQAGVPIYWIINLVEGQIEVYERPVAAEGRYEAKTEVVPGQVVTLPMGGPVLQVAVTDILPP